MRILLTGGAGFIGAHVATSLRAQGHDVRVFDLRDDGGADTTVGDVRDGDAVERALAGVDAVCHLAAKVGMGVDAQDTPDYADTNVRGTAVVLAAMSRAGVRRIVLASSMVVYGEGLGRCALHGEVAPAPRRVDDLRARRFESPCPRCGRPLEPALVREDAPIDPRSAYAASKAAQEHFVASWARSTGGGAAMLRYHNVYGPGLPRDTPYAGVAAIFRSSVLRGDAPQVYEDGGQLRDFVHVRDIAAATALLLETHDDGTVAVNVGSGTPRTVGDLAAALAREAGAPTPSVTGRFRLGDVRHIVADSGVLRDRYGWRPEVDFDAGVAELLPVTSG